YVRRDLFNEGTLTSVGHGPLLLGASRFVSEVGSNIVLNGVRAGQSGGDLSIEAHALALIRGHITTQGGDASVASAGGVVSIFADGPVYNAGAIDSSGIDGTNVGGNGGTVRLTSRLAFVANAGAITAAGGKGSTQG